MKNESYIVNLGECRSTRTPLIPLYASGNNGYYFFEMKYKHEWANFS